MEKCESCGIVIKKIFLNKIIGTIIKDEKGKFHYFCNECQSNGKVLKK